MVKMTRILREGIQDNEELDLAEIDRGLDIAIEAQIDEAIDDIVKKSK